MGSIGIRGSRIIRVFPRKTSLTPSDEYAFVGPPPMIRPEADEVHVSCTFTWDIERAKNLAQAWGQYYPVKIGGPAFDDSGDDFTPGEYVRDGCVFLSRGCDNGCPWCLVKRREGNWHRLTIRAGNIIQDNNFLQGPADFLHQTFAMLKTQRDIQLSGGLEARRVTDAIADEIRSLRIGQVFLAADTKEALPTLRTAINRLQLPRQKVRCYVLLHFKETETISEATERLEDVWQAGAMPFAQLYQPPDHWIDYSPEWKELQRNWQRPAIMNVLHRKVAA